MALDEGKGWFALIMGLIVAALGVIPLLSKWGVIGLTLPEGLFKVLDGVAIWLVAGIALFLFIDALMEDDTIRAVSVIIAIVLFALGLIQILGNFGVLGFTLPFGAVVYYILLSLEGFFLIIAGFAMN